MITMYKPQNNSPFTSISEGISTTTTTIMVADGSVLPDAPNVLTIGIDDSAELVLMTAKSSNVLTVTRAFNGTLAQAWDSGVLIYRAITAQDIEALQENIKEVDGKVDTAKQDAVSEAVATAAADATSKAETAKNEAISAAAADATSKANAAEANAKAASDPKGSAAAVQTNLDSHTGNSTIHVTADEKAAWSESDVFIATYSTTTSAEIEAAYQAGKAIFLQLNNTYPRVPLSIRVNGNMFGFIQTTSNVAMTLYQCAGDAWSTSISNTHASTHATGGSDPITPASIGAAAQSTTVTATLSAVSWTGDSAP